LPVSVGGPAQVTERAGGGLVVALGAQHREALALVGLDLRAGAQRLIRFVAADGELVDPDNGAHGLARFAASRVAHATTSDRYRIPIGWY
jgi:hypothetical protein